MTPVEKSATPHSETRTPHTAADRRSRDSRRWWVQLFVQPLLMLVVGGLLFAGLGVAQRMGWISGGGGHDHQHVANTNQAVSYICPMMCTPPQSEPGRCPVCAMELVPAAAGSGSGGSTSIEIDPVARRIANIQTVAVKSAPLTRTIRAVGELTYNEGSLKTISAYVDGRLDKLYADYTGVVVNKDDQLALVYSPKLYSGQIELLLAKKATQENRAISSSRFQLSDDSLYDTARERLIELGMTKNQIEQLERSGEANSRMRLLAPISGTVIEKLAVEGQYVKEGQAIYQLADLSTVWLMLELFPEDAAVVRHGQLVQTVVQSLPNRTFTGEVAFIDPQVDPKTRTVSVRVVIENDKGLLRVGDFAKATINVPMGSGTGERIASDDALVVPRSAVLMAGANSVVYVETEAGRFEIRRVTLGPQSEDQIVILQGVSAGEKIATRGNFLIDSQMQLAGNPSLIDPTKAVPSVIPSAVDSETVIAALKKLSADDRRLAEDQRICPVTKQRLGAMGTPQKVNVAGQPVWICCEGCRQPLLDEPEEHLQKLNEPSPLDEEQDLDFPAVPPIEAIQLIEPVLVEPRVANGRKESAK